ncbi:hypothetical protein MTR_1g069415 [Medicago truncatula]|uniref:Uncharacterized protein n=1 Tax=Medicago truncatula TaxID=3880 RepID=A0A072VKY0_MEDTR|nr:hypothetical protein MTR_1g069415 [Medicago truncatula]
MRLRRFLGRRHVKKKQNDCFDGTNLEQRKNNIQIQENGYYSKVFYRQPSRLQMAAIWASIVDTTAATANRATTGFQYRSL